MMICQIHIIKESQKLLEKTKKHDIAYESNKRNLSLIKINLKSNIVKNLAFRIVQQCAYILVITSLSRLLTEIKNGNNIYILIH